MSNDAWLSERSEYVYLARVGKDWLQEASWKSFLRRRNQSHFTSLYRAAWEQVWLEEYDRRTLLRPLFPNQTDSRHLLRAI